MEWVDGMTSVTGEMKNDNPDFDLYWAKLNMTQQDIEAEMDYDREMRQLAIELVFDVELESWKTERVMSTRCRKTSSLIILWKKSVSF